MSDTVVTPLFSGIIGVTRCHSGGIKVSLGVTNDTRVTPLSWGGGIIGVTLVS